jgi:hypothetical protein
MVVDAELGDAFVAQPEDLWRGRAAGNPVSLRSSPCSPTTSENDAGRPAAR